MIAPLLGGALIGLAASILLVVNGRIAGIAGIVGSLVVPQRGDTGWRVLFVAGLLGGGLLVAAMDPGAITPSTRPLVVVALAGLLVGFGTRLGSGCTSGHGVCGISRFSVRSVVATVTFIATGAMVVGVGRLL